MLWLVTLKVALLIVVLDFTVGTVHPFDLPKTVLSRAMAWILAALLGLALARYGPGILPKTRLHVFVALYLLANAVSAIFAVDPYVAAFGDEQRRLGLTFLLDMTLLYLAIASAFRDRSDAIILGGGILLAAAITVAYVIIQRLGLDPIYWSPDSSRLFSTLGNSNIYGQFLSLVFGLGVGLFVGRSARDRLLGVVALAIALVALAVAAVVATRGTALGVLGCLGAAPFVFVRVRKSRIRGALAALALTSLATIALAAAVSGTPLGQRLHATLEAGVQTEDRVALWRSAISAFADRPVLGWGPDGFRAAYPTYRPFDATRIYGLSYTADSAHNWLFQAMATTGALGALALLAMVIGFHAALWKSGVRRYPLVASAILVGAVGWWINGLVTVGMIGVDWWPWLSFGVTAALTGEDVVPSLQRTLPRWMAPVALGAAAAVALTTYSSLNADHWMYRGLQRTDASGVEFTRLAVTEDPGRAEHWNELGRSLFWVSDFKGSGDAFASAAARAPYQATFWSNLARARVRQALAGDDSSGGGSAAMAAAQRAATVDPNNPSANEVVLEIASALGEYNIAVVWGVRALELAPRTPAFEQALGTAARRAPDRVAALSALSRVRGLRDSTALNLAAADLALAIGNVPDARGYAARALELDPQNAEAREILQRVGG
jgi:O-antigen ligase/tetratricopeptide (TPR) repeat protein